MIKSCSSFSTLNLLFPWLPRIMVQKRPFEVSETPEVVVSRSRERDGGLAATALRPFRSLCGRRFDPGAVLRMIVASL